MQGSSLRVCWRGWGMILSELKLIKEVLETAHEKPCLFSNCVLCDDREKAELIIQREIKLKEMDPRK